MKSLLLQATHGKDLIKEKYRHVGRSSPTREYPNSLDGATTGTDAFSDGYTSGAFNSDDDAGSLSFCLEPSGTPNEGVAGLLSDPLASQTCAASSSPGSRYSLGDFASLSTLIPKSCNPTQYKSPPRKSDADC